MFIVLIFKYFVTRATCESPKVASDYLKAAKLWYKMHQVLEVVPYNEKYSGLVSALEESTSEGVTSGQCPHM